MFYKPFGLNFNILTIPTVPHKCCAFNFAYINPFHLGYDSRCTSPFHSEYACGHSFHLPFLISVLSLWRGLCGIPQKSLCAHNIYTLHVQLTSFFVKWEKKESFLSIFSAKWQCEGSDIATDLSDRQDISDSELENVEIARKIQPGNQENSEFQLCVDDDGRFWVWGNFDRGSSFVPWWYRNDQKTKFILKKLQFPF